VAAFDMNGATPKVRRANNAQSGRHLTAAARACTPDGYRPSKENLR
jgi:hypothetical protein